LALRVVQPGLLGNPSAILIPLAGHPRGIRSVWPFFRLFLPEVETLMLLRGMVVSPLQFQHLSLDRTKKLRAEGFEYIREAVQEINRDRGGAEFSLDSRVVVCDDMAREIVVHASKSKTQLILLGASERDLPRRLISGDLLEEVLRETPCDAAIYSGA
jgi:nucleotide-binding universal stress UspA family protein